jgi:deazaflavin-dependent oxidoreductase (nitroreductase family)
MMGTGTLMFRFGAKVQGRPLLKLTTVGAKTGKQRVAVLGWFPDEPRSDSWLVVASNAGSARHPGWAFNLARNPDQVEVDIGDGDIPVTVEMLEGEQREAMWRRVVEMAPGYGAYTEKTDREMPIFRLTAESR